MQNSWSIKINSWSLKKSFIWKVTAKSLADIYPLFKRIQMKHWLTNLTIIINIFVVRIYVYYINYKTLTVATKIVSTIWRSVSVSEQYFRDPYSILSIFHLNNIHIYCHNYPFSPQCKDIEWFPMNLLSIASFFY